jgi:hypothetical protein
VLNRSLVTGDVSRGDLWGWPPRRLFGTDSFIMHLSTLFARVDPPIIPTLSQLIPSYPKNCAKDV